MFLLMRDDYTYTEFNKILDNIKQNNPEIEITSQFRFKVFGLLISGFKITNDYKIFTNDLFGLSFSMYYIDNYLTIKSINRFRKGDLSI